MKRRGRIDPSQVNATLIKNTEAIVSQQHPSSDPGDTVTNAPAVNRLAGSGLMREDASRIRLLFPLVNSDTPPVGGDPLEGPGFYGPSIAAGATREIGYSGDGILWFYSTEAGTPRLFFRLSRNAVRVTDWIPISRIINYGQPAAVGTVTPLMQIGGTRDPIFRIPFSKIEVANFGNGGGGAAAARCNAYIFIGGADVY